MSNKTSKKATLNMRQYGMMIMLIVVYVFFAILTGGKNLTPMNINNLIMQNGYVVILAVGMLLCVLTGTVELGGGSIRSNDPALQDRMFHALGFTEEKARESFGFLMDAYKFGAPPHGGMAYGLDRMEMLMLKKDSIRDVIAFPKVQNAGEPMAGAPEAVDPKQLADLKLAMVEE